MGGKKTQPAKTKAKRPSKAVLEQIKAAQQGKPPPPPAKDESASGSYSSSYSSYSSSSSSSYSADDFSSDAEAGAGGAAKAAAEEKGAKKKISFQTREEITAMAEAAAAEGRVLGESDMKAACRRSEEGEKNYRVGGYYPVVIGERFKDGRYVVYSKLGWGYFSTVWKVLDSETKAFVALKVVRSSRTYAEVAESEIEFQEKMTEHGRDGSYCCMRMLDHFVHKGPNGSRLCPHRASADDAAHLLFFYIHRHLHGV